MNEKRRRWGCALATAAWWVGAACSGPAGELESPGEPSSPGEGGTRVEGRGGGAEAGAPGRDLAPGDGASPTRDARPDAGAEVAEPVELARGLVAHWTFDEGSGETVGDASGNGNTGTLSGNPAWTE